MPDESPDVAAKLVARLDREAELVDHGSFTLVLEQARARLASHRLADPQSFVVLPVEAAHLLECSAVVVEQAANATRVRLEGAQLSKAELGGLFDAMFMDSTKLEPQQARRVEARRQLGLALESARGLPHRALELRSLGPEGTLALRVDAGGSLSLDERPGVAEPAIELEIRDAHRAGLGRRARAVYQARRDALAHRCRHATLPVFVDGVRVDEGPVLRELTEPVELRGRGGELLGHAGRSRGRRVTTVIFVANGVVIEECQLPGGGSGRVALVDATSLGRDLSLFRLRRGNAFHERMSTVREVFDALPEDRLEAIHAPLVSREEAGLGALVSLALGGICLLAGLALMLLIARDGSFAALIGLVFGGVGILIIRRGLAQRRELVIEQTGAEALAIVVSMEGLDSYQGERDKLRLRVRVELPDRPAFLATIETHVRPGESSAYQLGACYYARVGAGDQVVLERAGRYALPA